MTWVSKEGTTPDSITGFLQLALRHACCNTQSGERSAQRRTLLMLGAEAPPKAQRPASQAAWLLAKRDQGDRAPRWAMGVGREGQGLEGAAALGHKQRNPAWEGGERSSAGLLALPAESLGGPKPVRSRVPSCKQPGTAGPGWGTSGWGISGWGSRRGAGEGSQGSSNPVLPGLQPHHGTEGFLGPVQRLFVQANPLGVY